MTKNALYIALALTLVVGLLFYGESPEKLLGKRNITEKEEERYPYAVARNASTRHFAGDGSLDYEFHAQRLEHYQRDDDERGETTYTLINAPRLTLYQQPTPWEVTANEGRLEGDGNTIELWGDVIIRQQGEDGIRTQLTTERLEIVPAQKFAQTAETVKIISPRGEMTGEGMTADLETKRIKLLAKVRGTHESIF